MGTCNCICKKTTESHAEILSEKKEYSSLIDNPQEATSIVPCGLYNDNPATNSLLNQEVVPDPINLNKGLIQAQSVFRGHISRLDYSEYTECNLSPLISPLPLFKPAQFTVDFSNLPQNFPSAEAREKYLSVGNFDFGQATGGTFQELLKLFDGNFYQGEVDNFGNPYGKGTMFFVDGSFYEGGWKLGKMNGEGRIITSTGDVYKANFEDGRMTGYGEMEYSNGNKYAGGLLYDKPHGYGEEIGVDGTIYKGEYKDGLKNGKGKSLWTDGSYFEGEFLNDLYDGVGKYSWTDKVYEGQWKESKMHGIGTFTWSDGKVYSGEYDMGIKQGYGVFTWPDGKKYEGNWLDGKQDGEGTLTNNKKKKRGFWKEGKFIGKNQENQEN